MSPCDTSNKYVCKGSFKKRQTGGTTSDNERQRVVERMTTSDKEWQWMTTSDNEWQRATKNDNEWQWMTASDQMNENEWE